MKRSFTRSSTLANYLVLAVLAIVPFHAFLTVWLSSLVGHYTILRLWDDVALLALFGLACWWLVRDAGLRSWFFRSLLVRLILAYAGLTFLMAGVSYLKHDVTLKAVSYGLLVNLRFLAWFLGVLLAAQRSDLLKRSWPRLVAIPAVLVVVFAVLQYTVLPHNLLTHAGYDAHTTIAPIETINHNVHYIRVQSTLRGANPLGAYLVIVLSVLGTLLMRGHRRLLSAGLGLLALAALYASGSRSAWIGTILSLATVGWLQLTSRRARLVFAAAGLGLAVLALGAFLVLKSNTGLENAVLHTQNHSASAVSSNQAHASALKNGVEDTLHQPFGDGPGTAGPASEYNGTHSPRIAENYYLQIAEEVGWLGLALFISILGLVGLELYQQAGRSRLALALLASLIGLSFVNLLSHAWADDTLAYLWWGLAGIALAVPVTPEREAA
jgi:hypothetical protein